MVDVSNKTTTTRKAIARCRVVFPPDAWDTLTASGFAGKKGPVLATAVVAGVQGAKRTSELIPFCHPVALDACDVSFEEQELALEVTCAVTTTHRTGVEMEALSGASIAALAVYDMTKALSHSIRVEDLRLIEKTGGKSDYKTCIYMGGLSSSSCGMKSEGGRKVLLGDVARRFDARDV